MKIEIETLDDLESFVLSLEKEIHIAVSNVTKTLPLKVPRQIKMQGIAVPLIEVKEIGEERNQYVVGRPNIVLDIDIANRRGK